MMLGFSSPSPYLAESIAIFNAYSAAGVTPSASKRVAIDTLVRSLITDGTWAKTDRFFVFAAPNQASALINWKSPGNGDATLVGTPTFTTNEGFTGNGTDYIALNYTPAISGGFYSLDSASVGVWTRTDLASDARDIGIASLSGAQLLVGLNPRTAANLFSARINDATSFTVASGSSIGYWAINRSGATAREFYKDGTSIGSDTVPSTALSNAGIAALRFGADRSLRQVSLARISGSLLAGEQAAEYAAINTYIGTL